MPFFPHYRQGLLLLVCALVGSPSIASEIEWQRDIDAAWQRAQDEELPLLVFATRDHCRYCTLMKHNTYTDERLARQINGGFIPLVVDAGSEPEFMQELGVQVYPTTVVISPGATIVDRVRGYVQAAKMRQQLHEAQRRAIDVDRQQSARNADRSAR